MQKENGCTHEFEGKNIISHSKLDLESSTPVVAQQPRQQRAWKTLNQVQGDGSYFMGFTLIELLVVVLIIGILAAVALPQYQKAVWKSRATQLLTATRSLATAQEAHYMASGEYATSFGELALDFSSLEPRATSFRGSVSSTDAVRGNDLMEVMINYSSGYLIFSTSNFITGPYTGGGFLFSHYANENALDKKMYCMEATSFISVPGSFCTKLFKATHLVATKWYARYYEMP